MHITLEPALIFIYLENCAGIGGWVYRCGETFGAVTDDSIFIFEIVYRSRTAKWRPEYRSWIRFEGRTGHRRKSGSESCFIYGRNRNREKDRYYSCTIFQKAIA